MFEVNREPIDSWDVFDFYDYQGTILGVIRSDSRVVTQCGTLQGAKRHIISLWTETHSEFLERSNKNEVS